MGFPVMVFVVSFMFPLVEQSAIKHKERESENSSTTQDIRKELDVNSAFMAAYYLVNVLILLAITTTLKRLFNRTRPTRPDYENPECKNGRHVDVRSRETNASFPSGDAAQAGLFSFFLMINYQQAIKLLGGPLTTA